MPDFLDRRLDRLRQRQTLRELPGHREGVDFWSNDYLGFARLERAATTLPTITPGSRLISGDHSAIHDLEARIADFHGHPTALLFGSGYLANLGLLSCLADRTDTIVYDELIHASLRDGIRLSGAAARRCKHNSAEDAERLLARSRPDGERFLITEGRFSMDGDTAPLEELASMCERTGAHLIVDEAHSVGLDGPCGAGLVAASGLQSSVLATVVTYGKAPGLYGAAVLGAENLRQYLINFCRPFIYTTGPHVQLLTELNGTYALLRDNQPEARKKLGRVIETYRKVIQSASLSGAATPEAGPIQLVRVGDTAEVIRIEEALHRQGYLVKGIRSPTVAAGTERLRICLHAFNTDAEVGELVRLIAHHLPS